MKILNLYAGIGGNRKLWGDEHQITAVENDQIIADIYKDFFPNDEIIVDDAHNFLLKNFYKYDFIWSSPPCQSHSSFRQNLCVRYRGTIPVYPDMSLYQEIIFLQYNYKNKWIIENVKPYYKYLINPSIMLGRHFFWCNFKIKNKIFKNNKIRTAQIKDLQKKYNINLDKYKLKNKRQILRNCVMPELGKHILDCAICAISSKSEQLELI
ncbi:MAG: DNA cytosine methyltransferase [Promethearchaeia archaeon]